ncbi:MAG: peptidylprolyl isomerase [Chitinophagaceae bacterium]|jgi:cyclophilin family peptidyl-prolyl cis-trans isomerase|nr:peptidylprolyl isomerase [Bacteroidota bacterium]MBP9932488.1 peptidylprolyl isomerase [Chitinophagaceae bacterium]
MKKIFSLLIILSLAIGTFAQKNKNKFVEIETTMGKIKIELFADVPQHSENFLKLVKDGFYDSLLFHRVIPSFMIQGGDPDSKNALDGQMLGNGDVGYKIPAEFMVPKYYHKKGALAAARDNNPEKASSGCQFYIVVGRTFTDQDLTTMEQRGGFTYSEQAKKDYKTIGGTPHLDNGYTVFGQVVEGQEVVDAIAMTPRNASDRPNENVRILSMKIRKK